MRRQIAHLLVVLVLVFVPQYCTKPTLLSDAKNHVVFCVRISHEASDASPNMLSGRLNTRVLANTRVFIYIFNHAFLRHWRISRKPYFIKQLKISHNTTKQNRTRYQPLPCLKRCWNKSDITRRRDSKSTWLILRRLSEWKEVYSMYYKYKSVTVMFLIHFILSVVDAKAQFVIRLSQISNL